MICDIFLPIMPAIFAHWGREVQFCANLAHILRIGEISTYIAHWRNKYNLAQIVRIYCALGKGAQSCANLPHILHIGERSTILHKFCGYIADWERILRIYSALNIQCATCASCAKYNKPTFTHKAPSFHLLIKFTVHPKR